jgi:hypothetical protein
MPATRRDSTPAPVTLLAPYRPLFDPRPAWRYAFLTGGRGSGKSFHLSVFLLNLTYETGHVILFTRYTMESAGASIIPEFAEKIELLGKLDDFAVTKTTRPHTQTYTTHTPQLRRHTNLHTGVDGGTCLACSAGKYKPVDGSAECSTCPLNSYSSVASTNQTDCKCNPGYTGEDEHPRQTQNTNTHMEAHMHNTNSSTHIHTHYTLVFIRKHHSDTKAQTYPHMHKHAHTTHTITQVKTAVPA